MLLVKTILKPSLLGGMGLFAGEDIKKGQLIWKYSEETCLILTKPQFTHVEKTNITQKESSILEHFLIYGYYGEKINGVVLHLDNERFINHSDAPNRSGGWDHAIANHDIRKGEELTDSYSSYDSCDWFENLKESYKIWKPDNVKPHAVS